MYGFPRKSPFMMGRISGPMMGLALAGQAAPMVTQALDRIAENSMSIKQTPKVLLSMFPRGELLRVLSLIVPPEARKAMRENGVRVQDIVWAIKNFKRIQKNPRHYLSIYGKKLLGTLSFVLKVTLGITLLAIRMVNEKKEQIPDEGAGYNEYYEPPKRKRTEFIQESYVGGEEYPDEYPDT